MGSPAGRLVLADYRRINAGWIFIILFTHYIFTISKINHGTHTGICPFYLKAPIPAHP